MQLLTEFTQRQLEYWQQFSEAYGDHQNNLSVFALTLFNMLRVSQAEQILDAGCGVGYLHPYLIAKKLHNTKLTAIDFCPQMVERAAARVKKFLTSGEQIDQYEQTDINDEVFQSVNYQLQVASVEALPFEDSTFDVYVSNLVFQLVEHQDKAFSEANRVLKSGGRFGIAVWSVPEHCTAHNIVKNSLIQVGVLPPTVDNRYIFDRQVLIDRAKQANFENILCWEQTTAFAFMSVQDIMKFANPNLKASLMTATQEKQDQFWKTIEENFKQFTESNSPLIFSCYMLTANKK